MTTRRRNGVSPALAVALGAVLAAGCSQYGAKPPIADFDVCAADPARCERLCAGCDDREQCYRDAGECRQRGGALVMNNDTGDPGDWVFIGGCHFNYTDAACTQNAAFVDGDSCVTNVLIGEWTTTPCHRACFDLRDCDVECRRLGLGGGTCVKLPNHCGPNRNSAYCQCQNGQPPLPPDPLPPNPSAAAQPGRG